MRKIAIWAYVPTLFALLISGRASALVLGDMDMNSYLNQPLDARIKVLPDEAVSLDEVHVGLAPESAFHKAGIERRPLPGSMEFKIVKGDDGIPVIRLTSQEPIKEPLLDIILEVTWPNGHLQREYTAFLDPQTTTPASTVTNGQQPDGVSGKRNLGKRVTQQQETSTMATPPAIATRSIEPKLTHDSYGPTMRPDALWSIAKAVRPDDSVSIPQVMLALVKKNPEAFYNDNVNALKAGYVLRIPGKALINKVSEVEADKEVKLQYRRWVQSRHGTTPPAGSTGKSGSDGAQGTSVSKNTVMALEENAATGRKEGNHTQGGTGPTGATQAH